LLAWLFAGGVPEATADSLTTDGDMDGENKILVLPNLEELEIYASVLLLL
jgi:hypothetical protein